MTMSVLALPDLAYDHLQDPAEAHRLIGEARRISPIAMGPHGPEVLTYDLVRSVLRDDRFAMPKGITPGQPGHHVGPVVGPGHQGPVEPRRRGTPPAAPAGVQGIHPEIVGAAAHRVSST